jgi:hypothetical protein
MIDAGAARVAAHRHVRAVLALSTLGAHALPPVRQPVRVSPSSSEFTDFVWLARIKHVLAANDQFLPEIGKYNAGQKFVFWSQFVLVGTLLVTVRCTSRVWPHSLSPTT